MSWQHIKTAPLLEAVLTCQAGNQKSIRLMYCGDGSAKHPATWICEVTRQPIDEFEMPDFWAIAPLVPAAREEGWNYNPFDAGWDAGIRAADGPNDAIKKMRAALAAIELHGGSAETYDPVVSKICRDALEPSDG